MFAIIIDVTSPAHGFLLASHATMKWLRSILLMVICAAYCYLLNVKMGILPPLGKLLSPYAGFWQNNEPATLSNTSFHIAGLKAPVKVVLDDNLVPHVFASNNHDLYLAQGYIHAKYRLWQMEFLTHAAAGRVSEIVGIKALAYDRQQRHFGMVYAAENAEAAMEKDSMMKEATMAYTAGVNAYIESLSAKDFPIEYKLLDYEPEPWTPLKCALLLKYMSYDLAGHTDDYAVTNVLKKFGLSAIDSLFSNHPYTNDPIIPAGTKWDFTPLPIPAMPQQAIADAPSPIFDHQPNPDNGSNNWVVNGSKTASGMPVLCGDPHLGLNLPSIWYQMQLVSPDGNATGVSLPGVPTIIIGFNDSIAWSETNVDADVLDWYSVKFKDASHREYFYDHQWKPTTKRVERIKVRGAEDVVDTVVYTHHGPVVKLETDQSLSNDFPVGYAMRWLGHDESSELNAFLLFNRAKNYPDFVKALTYFSCPAQNFIYADAANNIAIWVNGKFPLKWKDQGKFLMDGAEPGNDWQGWIPHEQDPHVKNPPQQYLCSANQFSTDGTYPYYLNWRMSASMRAHRINEQLKDMQGITADDMRILQFDNKNMVADFVKDEMVSAVDEIALNDFQRKQLNNIRLWDNMADASSIAQTVFDTWWNNLKNAIWRDEFGGQAFPYPNSDILLSTVKYNINKKWIDNINTTEVETLQQLINSTFAAGLDTLEKRYGSDTAKWQWALVKNTHINHLLRIPAFSRIPVISSGNSGIVNATGYDHGPSWRMIVELGKQPKAYGIYPGGQSGNPGSPFYENMIDAWSKGMQNELLILHHENETNPRISATINLSN